MRECALDGCDRLVRRRGAKYCRPAHKQRAFEIRRRNRAMVDAAIAQIRQAALGMEKLRDLVYQASGPFDRTGPAS